MAAPVFHNNMTLGDLLDVLRTMNDEERMQFYNQLNISLELTIVGEREQRPEGHDQAPTGEENEAGEEETEDDEEQDVIDVSEGEGDFTGYGEEAEAEDEEMKDQTEDDDEEEDEQKAPAPSRGPRRRRGSDIHFSELLTAGVIVPGNHLAIPTADNTGVLATMVYVSHHGRVSTWNVACPSLNIYGQISGTGPLEWIRELQQLGITPPARGTWSRGVRVIANGRDIGGITDLKIQHG